MSEDNRIFSDRGFTGLWLLSPEAKVDKETNEPYWEVHCAVCKKCRYFPRLRHCKDRGPFSGYTEAK